MKMMCMIILLLIFPVYFALKINKKISDVKNHILFNMYKHISHGWSCSFKI